MKIKKLSLRNIASIESADIDFEHGLYDAVTGKPAGTFLIYGDTGAGKSVILDGIAMALYKKTPRIVDPEGKVIKKRDNKFSDAKGESVDVFDIRQYTRLGISPADDCYSEVVFEGNDGKEYCARLTLGVYLGNTTPNGLRPIKYKDPQWEVTIGNKVKQDVDKKTGEPILSAIGLTFEQFSRMAMLAQGQFASFLTGDKTERERILETLTDTQHFSKYGEAISRLFTAANKRKELTNEAYNTIDELLKGVDNEKQDEEQKQLNAERKEKEDEKKTVDEKLGIIGVIEAEKGKIEAARKKLEGFKETYRLLSSDLLWKYEHCKRLEESLVEPAKWLVEREDKRAVYESAGKNDIQLGNLKTAKENKANGEKEKNRLEALTNDLKKDFEARKTEEEDARKKLDEKQEKIKKLTEQRNELNPEEANKSLNSADLRKKELGNLEESINHLAEAVKSVTEQGEKIKEAEKKLNEELLLKKDEAESNWEKADKADKEARELLTTMKMSVEDTLVNLRKRLAAEHTDTCPLCGQHISELHVDDDFKALVTPLQKKQEETAEKLKEAAIIKEEATGKYNDEKASISKNKGKNEEAKANNEAKKKELNTKAIMLGLDIQQPLLPQIEPLRQSILNEIGKLEETLRNAKIIQDQINELHNDKTIDNKLLGAIQARKDAESKLNLNYTNIANQTTIIKNASDTITPLLDELHALLDNIYPEWEKNIDDTRVKLKRDSSEYVEKRKDYENNIKKLGDIKREMAVLSQTRVKVLELCPEWNGMEIKLEPLECSNIQSRWTDFYSECKSKKDEIKNANDEIAAKMQLLKGGSDDVLPDKAELEERSKLLFDELQELNQKIGQIQGFIETYNANVKKRDKAKEEMDNAKTVFEKWKRLNDVFGSTRFRTLVQSYILQPLLNNANIYLAKITDRYTLTCSEENEQLAILVLDNYNQGQVRSATVLSGGERFMISLALSLALSSLNRPDLNVDILFIDEGFGTLDEKNLESVMSTLETLQDIAGQSNRRVGIISHREELEDRIPVKILVKKKGQGRSGVEIVN
ncbi:MAG: SMC family ATPase [Bacteroidales bacterium]|nr:SMC family ATPase [Bacteroidales bacterium]